MKVFVWASVCALAATMADVRPAAAQTVEGGIRGGVNRSSLSLTGLPDFEPDAGAGALAGGWVSVGSERVRVQTELLFATRRFSSASPIGDIRVSSRVVDVPVLVVGRWREGARTRPLLFAGSYVGFISGVTQTIGATETDIDNEIKGVDAGVTFGGGAEVATGRGAVVLDARFTFGLRDVSESPDTTFKSRGFGVSVGYRF